jgi:hypothetical protein
MGNKPFKMVKAGNQGFYCPLLSLNGVGWQLGFKNVVGWQLGVFTVVKML